jgi:hypothetical protein
MKKRLLYCIIALLLAASGGVAAWAEEPSDGGNIADTSADADAGSAVQGEVADADPVATENPDGDIPAPEAAEELVVNVVIPVTVDITIDPLEIGGRGQVYSDAYEIRNYGDTDVTLTFSDFAVIFANNTNFKALTKPYGETSKSDLKAIYLLLDFGRADIPPVVMTDASAGSVSIPLAAAGEGVPDEAVSLALRFSGDVNPYPGEAWNTGDVRVRLTYQLEAVPVPQEEIPLEEETLPEEAEPTVPEEDGTLPPEEEPAQPPAETETPPPGGATEPEPGQNPDQNTSGSALAFPDESPAS